MFPESFVEKQVRRHTSPGDVVLDCFSGRGTTVLQSLLMGRDAIGIDINPVAYCVSAAKAAPPELETVLDSLDVLEASYDCFPNSELEGERQRLPPFFQRAFHHETLRQILFLRRALAWRRSRIHRFISALTLGSLHGEQGKPMKYLSNQMPRTISTKPGYSLGYWRRNNLWPEQHDIFNLLRDRAEMRLDAELPATYGVVALGDARRCSSLMSSVRSSVSAIVTSPPYFNVTNYEEDQWLRLWFLGGAPRPTYMRVSKDDRHRRFDQYWEFLGTVWEGVAPLLKASAVIVVRLGALNVNQRRLTTHLTRSLEQAFSSVKAIGRPKRSRIRRRQANSFRPGSQGCMFETDYAFRVGQ